MLYVTLIGFGAIGRAVYTRVGSMPQVMVDQVVVSSARVAKVQAELGNAVAVSEKFVITSNHLNVKRVVLECAGHSALKSHVIRALDAGIECGILSVGALSEPGLAELISEAANRGNTQAHLLAGAVGGIDAIAAAKIAGLTSVTYTGRKPPSSWFDTPAQALVNLELLTVPTLILEASAREAASLYPKNANVAATVSLAGLGLDETWVRLFADPTVTENIHEIHAKGVFGDIRIEMRGKPLHENPKTSALTVLSALRFLHNQINPLTI